MIRFFLVLLLSCVASVALADASYSVSLPAGATGFRYRPVGSSAWYEGTTFGEDGQIEVEWLGLSYGATTIDLDQFPLDDGSVAFSIGPMSVGSGGASRSVTASNAFGSATFPMDFRRGESQSFGPEDLAVMVRVELIPRVGQIVAGSIGLWAVFFMLWKACMWCKAGVSECFDEDCERGDESRVTDY